MAHSHSRCGTLDTLSMHAVLYMRARLVPTLMQGELEGRQVLQVVAGYRHLCVTNDGSVFAFRYNELSQLGVGETEDRLVPTQLRGELENKLVLQVAAGGHLTIFVVAAARRLVFECGVNNKGQLSVGDTETRLVPTLVTGQL